METVMALALLYHDVVEPGLYDSSGFAGPGAGRYKLTVEEFRVQLSAIAAASIGGTPPIFTIDDGGASACIIAAELEQYGWIGHFFVATDWIGSPGFLDAGQIRNLKARGHQIGTHSCSHPVRMSSCGPDRLVAEWRDSGRRLAEILGEPVTSGSVPGGYYSRAVAGAAASAGLRLLFTSEPTLSGWTVSDCEVVGRYTIYRGMSGQAAAALVSPNPAARIAQAITWRSKKLVKRLGGPAYIGLRSSVLKYLYGDTFSASG
jgi:peptidoglycan/xylan/chitin deacetylase (PgdA/CDA1 family)